MNKDCEMIDRLAFKTAKPDPNIVKLDNVLKAINDSMDLVYKIVPAVNDVNNMKGNDSVNIETNEYSFGGDYMVKTIQCKKLRNGYSACITTITDIESNRIIHIDNSFSTNVELDRKYAYGILMTYLKNIVIIINEAAKTIIDTYIPTEQ